VINNRNYSIPILTGPRSIRHILKLTQIPILLSNNKKTSFNLKEMKEEDSGLFSNSIDVPSQKLKR